MIRELAHYNSTVRERNLTRKKRDCLMCDRSFTTTAVTRICGRCHKILARTNN